MVIRPFHPAAFCERRGLLEGLREWCGVVWGGVERPLRQAQRRLLVDW